MSERTIHPSMKTSGDLATALASDQYAGYAYSYPHKSSYRSLDPSVALSDAWSSEDKSQLFLYVHLPFCEMRCGFCNLFTASQPPGDLIDHTIDSITRQSRIVTQAVNPQSVAQVAIGGGTPTYLEPQKLRQVLEMIHLDWPVDSGVPFSVEVSPATIDAAKLGMLHDYGARRISMGVQSFVDRDLSHLGRPQNNNDVEDAIELIRGSKVEIFNLDLIYGSHDQIESDWIHTVKQAITYQPEELFLYPLYVREMTGLGRTGRSPSENRRHLYQLGRDLALQAGYTQISMRMFRRNDVEYPTQHCCQEDGMIGLGPGARSYTSNLHYSSDYAVSRAGVRKIIGNFNNQDARQFEIADYGVWLTPEDQQRRYLIRSLLQSEGLDRKAFAANYGDDVQNLIPDIDQLVENNCAEMTPDQLFLTEYGLAHSDVIGPWLYSKTVKSRMEQFQLK